MTAIASAPSPPIPRMTGTYSFCFEWVRAIAQHTLHDLCRWWRYIGLLDRATLKHLEWSPVEKLFLLNWASASPQSQRLDRGGSDTP
jgi:hypothetical protein